MKRLQLAGACAAMGVAALSGCADNAVTQPKGVTIQVAPLDLPGVGDASYTLWVENADGQPVWNQTNITANQYGNGQGDITYIGTCDADDGVVEQPATATNTVFLVLDSLTDTNEQPITEFQNPCPSTAPCSQEILCTENADTQVTFNITIMRDANQGFFDIAVNFQDLFCSAKFDCEYADGSPIKLLFNNGVRDNTSVLAFACTAGAGVDTQLYMDDIEINCTSPTQEAFLAAEVETAPTNLGNQAGGGPLFGYAVYQGLEQLAPYTKLYWNVALGWSSLALRDYTCTVRARATAAEAGLDVGEGGGFYTPDLTSYPVVDFNVKVGLDQAGNLNCGAHPLNGIESGVTTQYSLVDGVGECFDNETVSDDPDVSRTNDECAYTIADLDKRAVSVRNNTDKGALPQ